MRSMHSIFTALLVLLAPAVARGGEPIAAGVYRHLWQTPGSAEWTAIGLMSLSRKDGKLVVEPLSFTYVGRDTTLPTSIEVVRDQPAMVEIRLDFGIREQLGADGSPSEPKKLMLSYPFVHSAPGELTAPVMLDGKEIARTRLERLRDDAAVIAALKSTLEQIEVETAVSRAQIPSLRESVKFWLKQIDEDRRMNRQTTGTMTRMQLTTAEGSLTSEESRLGRLEAMERSCRELIIRMEVVARSSH